jgi:hypothetical protein
LLRTTKAFADYFGFERDSLEEIKQRIGLLLR